MGAADEILTSALAPESPKNRPDYAAARTRLRDFIDSLRSQRVLDVGTGDYVRIERVLVTLATKGIAPDDLRARAWIAPLVCTSPDEQLRFHRAFDSWFGPKTGPAAEEAAPLSAAEQAVVTEERKQSTRLRYGIAIATTLIVVVLGWLWIQSQTGSADQSAQPAPAATTQAAPQVSEFPMLSLRPLALIPFIAAFAFVMRRRSRRLWLLRVFAPAPQKSERVAFAGAADRFYASTPLQRSLGALRRHRAAPGRTLHIPRTLSATLRSGGRPELRFGTRPRTPEYVLLVDQDGPRDHMPVAADLLLRRLSEERIVVARYNYYGDPRRVLNTMEGQAPVELRLADLIALHADSSILLFAEAQTFFDARGRLHGWVAELRQWVKPVLITPRTASSWHWAERALEDEGFLVVPATSEGISGYAERLKSGHDVPMPAWPRLPDRKFDLPLYLEPSRGVLLDDDPPAEPIVTELLAELRAYLGSEAFKLLQALAVFPRLEPALTLYLSANLFKSDPKKTLDEAQFFALARLPWLRAGHMPDWLRLALISRLADNERERHKELEKIVLLIQAFLQPVEDSSSGGITLDIARRRDPGFRRALLGWIERDKTGQYDDQIFVGALTGRDPKELATPVPPTLARRLTRFFREEETIVTGLAAVAAGAIAFFHPAIVTALREVWQLLGLDTFVARLSDAVVGMGWVAVLGGLLAWYLQHRGAFEWLPRKAFLLVGVMALAAGCGSLSIAVSDMSLENVTLVIAASIGAIFIVAATNTSLEPLTSRKNPFARDHRFVSGAAIGLILVGEFVPSSYIAFASFGRAAIIKPFMIFAVELITIFWTTCAAFLFLRSVSWFEGDKRRAFDIAYLLGLAQSLMPVVVLGMTALIANHSPALLKAQADSYVLLRPASALLFLWLVLAPRGIEGRSGSVYIPLMLFVGSALVPLESWMWVQQDVATVLAGFVSPLSRSFLPKLVAALSAVGPTIPLLFAILACAWALTRKLNYLRRLQPVAQLFTFVSALFLVHPFRDIPEPLLVPFHALAYAASLAAVWPSCHAFSGLFEPEPPRLTWGDAWATVAARVQDLMPWLMVPVLWLCGSGVILGDFGIWFDVLYLPLVLWVAYRYPHRAYVVVLLSGLTRLCTLDLGSWQFPSDLAEVVAAICLTHLMVLPKMWERVLQANSITVRQVVFLLVGLGFALRIQSGVIDVYWSASNLSLLIVFLIGLSRIRLLPLIIATVLLTVAGILTNFEMYRRFALSALFDHPSFGIACLVALLIGRAIRYRLQSLIARSPKSAPRRWLVLYGALLLVSIAETLGIYSDVRATYPFIPPMAAAMVLVWVGVSVQSRRELWTLALLTLLHLILFFTASKMLPEWRIPLGTVAITSRAASWTYVVGLAPVAVFLIIGWKVRSAALENAGHLANIMTTALRSRRSHLPYLDLKYMDLVVIAIATLLFSSGKLEMSWEAQAIAFAAAIFGGILGAWFSTWRLNRATSGAVTGFVMAAAWAYAEYLIRVPLTNIVAIAILFLFAVLAGYFTQRSEFHPGHATSGRRHWANAF